MEEKRTPAHPTQIQTIENPACDGQHNFPTLAGRLQIIRPRWRQYQIGRSVAGIPVVQRVWIPMLPVR